MAIKTQLRTAQLTGSFGQSVGLITDQLSNANTGSISAVDLGAVLSNMASAIKRINGAGTFTSAASGVFTHTLSDFSGDIKVGGNDLQDSGDNVVITFDGSGNSQVLGNLKIGSGTAADRSILFDGNATDVRIGIDDGTDKLEIGTGAAMGTTTAITIDSSQQVAIVATTAASSTTTGALTVAGGASVAADLYIGDDLRLDSDGAVLGIGADDDITITHDAGTGGTLASAGAFVIDSTGSTLELNGNSGVNIVGNAAEVDITTTGAVDINSAAGTWDSSAGISLDAQGASNFSTTAGGLSLLSTGDAASFTVASDAAGEDLTIEQTGGNDSGVLVQAAGTGTDAIKLNASAGGIDIDAAGALAIDSATSIAIGANADKPIDIDSTTLDIDASGAITIDGTSTIGIGSAAAAGNISIGTNATAREVTIGNTTGASGVTIDCGSGGVDIAAASTTTTVKGALVVDQAATINGNLTVHGTTTTVDSVNLQVKDPLIALGTGNAAANSNGGIAIMSASQGTGMSAGKADMVMGRVANGTWGAGFADTQSGSITSLTSMAFANMRVRHLELSGANDYVGFDGTNLKVVAAADIVLSPGGNNVLPDANDGAALGSATVSWSDLFLADGGIINANNGNSTLTGGGSAWVSNVKFQATRLQVDSANDYLDVDTDFKMVAAADIVLDPGGSEVKVDGNLVPNSADGGALGSATLEWSDLFLADSSVIQLGNDQDVTLTHVPDVGVKLNTTRAIQFRDAASGFISSSLANNLCVGADGAVEIAAPVIKGWGVGDMLLSSSDTYHLVMKSAADLMFADIYRQNSTWSNVNGIKLASNSGEWNNFESQFGEVSLMNAIVSAAGGGAGNSKTTKELAAAINADTRVFGAGNGFDISSTPDAQENARIDVYVNGQLMLSGGAVGSISKDYALDVASGQADCDVQFNFALVPDDVVTVVVR